MNINKLILCVCCTLILFNLTACQSTAKKRKNMGYATIYDEYENFKKAYDIKDFVEARRALEKTFELSSSDEVYFELSGNLLASYLFSGAFGYFEQQGFIEVSQLMGDKLNDGLKYKLKEIDNYYVFKKDHPVKLSDLHQASTQYCSDSAVASNTLITVENEALHYLSSIDCVSEYLIKDKDARLLKALHFEFIGSRDNAKLKARGFRLYDTPSVDYPSLTAIEQQSVLTAKKQINAYKNFGVEPNFKIPSSESDKNVDSILNIMKQADTIVDNNFELINEKVFPLIKNDNVKDESKAFLLYFIMSVSYLENNLLNFDDYFERMKAAKYLTVENVSYINKMRLMILHNNGDYLEGLVFVDSLIYPPSGNRL